MAKHGMTVVSGEKFLAICNKLGLKVVDQPSQFRVADATGARRMYVPKTKGVHRIDLSGFTHELAVAWEDAFPGKKRPTSKVAQVVNFAQEEKLVLRSFFKIAKSLVAKAAPAPAPEVEAPATEPTVEAPAAEAQVG